MIIIKFISFIFAIWFTVLNIGLIKNKQSVPAINFLVQSITIALFIFIQFNLF